MAAETTVKGQRNELTGLTVLGAIQYRWCCDVHHVCCKVDNNSTTKRKEMILRQYNIYKFINY